MPERINHIEPAEAQERSYPYDALIVLGGGLYRREQGQYYPADYRHTDPFGMLGAGMRMVAATELYLNGQAKNIVFTTGKTDKNVSQFGEDVPTEASVYKTKFLRSLDGLRQRPDFENRFAHLEDPVVILEECSVNTASNVQEVLQLILDNGWQKVAIVSSDDHIPRVKALYDQALAQHPGLNCSLKFISAEQFVRESVPGKYDEVIEKYYHSDQIKVRLENEAQGRQDIADGHYTEGEFQLSDKKPPSQE